jgi:hypothetical protein
MIAGLTHFPAVRRHERVRPQLGAGVVPYAKMHFD